MFSKDELLDLHCGLNKYIDYLEECKKEDEDDLKFYMSIEDRNNEEIEIIADDIRAISVYEEKIGRLKLLASRVYKMYQD